MKKRLLFIFTLTCFALFASSVIWVMGRDLETQLLLQIAVVTGALGFIGLSFSLTKKLIKVNKVKVLGAELDSREFEVRELVLNNQKLSNEIERLNAREAMYKREQQKLKSDLASALHLWENANLARQEFEDRYRKSLEESKKLEEKLRLHRDVAAKPEKPGVSPSARLSFLE